MACSLSTTTAGYGRRKDPASVRAALLDAAVMAIARDGFARLTVDAVARAAGVTKGGLFHHFPSKQALIDGVLADMIASAERETDAAMATDPEPHGRFTRAYLGGVFGERDPVQTQASRSLCVAMLAAPALQDSWRAWVAGQVARHAATDDNPRCALARLAADGLWLASLSQPDRPPPIDADVHAALLALTRPLA